ncbi:MAG: tetratricopeptide repeat protein [Cyanobacteria bacterium J06635_10]
MRYSLKLLAATVFLVSSPVEALVTDNSSVINSSVVVVEEKIAQVEGKKQRKDEALRLNELGFQQLNKGEYREALNNFEQALVIVREIGERKGEGAILNNIGRVYESLGEYTRALDYYQQALAIHKQIGDKAGEGINLSNIGSVYDDLGEYTKALDYYQQALAIDKQVGNKSGEGTILNNIGSVYDNLGEYTKALDYYQQSLAITRQVGDKSGEGITLNSIGVVYGNLGEYPKALDYYQQSLAIFKQIGNKAGEGATLNSIGLVYGNLGEYPKALDYYQQSLAITKQIGNKAAEGITLNNIGNVYDSLGEYAKALDYHQQALAIAKQVSSKAVEGTTLSNIGGDYSSLGEYLKALDYYQQALAIKKQIGDKSGEGAVLDNIGSVYNNLGEYPQALDYFQQSLAIRKQIGDKAGEGTTLNNIGGFYNILGEYAKALDYYQQSLAIKKQIGDKSGEATTLNNIAVLLQAQKQPKLAIVFYKQSVSTYEQIRKQLKTLPKQQQESYTKTVAHTYRNLANLLISQDRILEAQQVLDLLKIQELNNYLTQVRGSNQKLVILKPEEEILKKYNQLQTSAIAIGQELTKLRKIPEKNRTTKQQQRIAELVKLETELNKQFNEFSERKDVIAQLDKLSRQAQEMAVKLKDLDGLRDDLKRLNAVMLYPLILDDRLELIITTPDSPPLRRTVQVKRSELNQVITEFRQALQNPDYDAKTPAQKLYSWLIKPLENDLKQSGAKTIIYAPDSQLRYIPLSALHDGEQWLVQRLNINNITAKSLTDFTAKPKPQPKVLAGAFVNGNYSFQVIGDNYRFQGLPFAGKEVENITKLLPKTTKLIDKQFNEEGMMQRMNEYNIVHFATHAAFVPGDASKSFILFGDGDIANLKEIGNWTLNNVDLVVLSACQTGIGGKFGNGEEILGLGYQFQSRGVRATIASLWKVSDDGTQLLMNGFYNVLQQKKITKAEALRQAQIALITNDYSAVGGKRGGLLVEGDGDDKLKQTDSKLQHPYYWAPFILIGNGL